MTRTSFPAVSVARRARHDSWTNRLGIIFALGLFSGNAFGSQPILPEPKFHTGFNQGWFDTRANSTYACTWLTRDAGKGYDPSIGNCYDPKLAEEILKTTRAFGGKVMRVWLFEDAGNQNLVRKNGTPKLHPSVLGNVRNFLTLARKHKVRVYWTLFADKLPVSLDPVELRDFLNAVVSPLLSLFSEYKDAVYAIDAYNEIDGGVIRGVFDQGPEKDKWRNANRFTCTIKNFVRARAKTFIPVTASLGWPWDPLHFYGGAAGTLGKQPKAECVDFYDFHHYEKSGGFPKCDSLKKLAQIKPVILGEFGQTGAVPWIREPEFPDQGDASGNRRARAIQKFLTQAKECGLSAALGWRLKEIDSEGRAVHNSFMGSGKVEKNGEAWDVSWFRWLSYTLAK